MGSRTRAGLTMAITSCGLLLWRRAAGGAIEVLIGHMGGPWWAHKDNGAWSIPKGEAEPGEDPLTTAEREFTEELGLAPPAEDPQWRDVDLGRASTSRKTLHMIARHGDLDPATGTPGTFTMEWPPNSGRTAEFPEMDRAEWTSITTARARLVTSQHPYLDRLVQQLDPAP